MSEQSLASCRKRKGTVRGCITKIRTKLDVLEEKIEDPTTLGHAQRLVSGLEELDAECRKLHFAIIDILEDEEEIQAEQESLDEHYDVVTVLNVRLQGVVSACSTSSTNPTNPRNVQSRKLQRLDRSVSMIQDALTSLDDGADNTCCLQQYQEELRDLKKDLGVVRDNLLTMSSDDHDELLRSEETLGRKISDCSLRVKQLLYSPTRSAVPATPSTDGNVKLPKLDVPTFNGDILNWRTFWEQFGVSVHNRTGLSDSEKLVYLQHALKSGSAKHTIEGLSRTGEHYAEAVECLCSRYDRPRLIHQTHVRMIIESPGLKDNSGKELRRFHDTMQQHLRALKAMGNEPPGAFVTSLLELKLDTDTMFEWQKHTQDSATVPHYQKLLEFINLRAQASESLVAESGKKNSKSEGKPPRKPNRTPVFSHPVNADVIPNNCVACKTDKHPLYACVKFKGLGQEQKLSVLRENRLCMNCLGSDHFVKQCKSIHRCKKCQKPHHTLLHVESPTSNTEPVSESTIPSHAAAGGLKAGTLVMTCQVVVTSPDGLSVEARALLDSASSASFISERLAQNLRLPRSTQNARITGIACLSHKSPVQSVADFRISAVKPNSKAINVAAIVVPRVTCDIPRHPIDLDLSWNHLSDLNLADPGFGQPGRIDLLLGVDIFAQVVLHGRRIGPPGSPVAFQTEFGWVLAGETNSHVPELMTAHHVSVETGDDILRKFWEIEHHPLSDYVLSPEEKMVMQHFKAKHFRTKDGTFIVPLPKKPGVKPLGESRSQAVRRFLSLERTLKSKNRFAEVDAVIQEYFTLGHAELVPDRDLRKSESETFYLPIHVVRKETSSTTKVRAVFDALALSQSGVSLNQTFLVGPTVHPPLVDVLLRFRVHRIALTTDVSKMYRAVQLVETDKDLHRFVWRSSSDHPLKDYRMTRVTFGVSASSFAVNMAVKQNAEDHASEFPLALKAVSESFYVDDGLTGADSVAEAITLQKELQKMFARGKFLLRKWNSNHPDVLKHVPVELRESQAVSVLPQCRRVL